MSEREWKLFLKEKVWKNCLEKDSWFKRGPKNRDSQVQKPSPGT
jgi:hypothetical protein